MIHNADRVNALRGPMRASAVIAHLSIPSSRFQHSIASKRPYPIDHLFAIPEIHPFRNKNYLNPFGVSCHYRSTSPGVRSATPGYVGQPLRGRRESWSSSLPPRNAGLATQFTIVMYGVPRSPPISRFPRKCQAPPGEST